METNHLSYLLPSTGAWLPKVRAPGAGTPEVLPLLFATWQQSTNQTGPALRREGGSMGVGWRSNTAILLPVVTWSCDGWGAGYPGGPSLS